MASKKWENMLPRTKEEEKMLHKRKKNDGELGKLEEQTTINQQWAEYITFFCCSFLLF